jgi:hypothetical protein
VILVQLLGQLVHQNLLFSMNIIITFNVVLTFDFLITLFHAFWNPCSQALVAKRVLFTHFYLLLAFPIKYSLQ